MFQCFRDEIDITLREFGVGDAVMGKRMKKMAQGFYGRAAAYREAFAESEDAVTETLNRNLFPDGGELPNNRLAAHLLKTRTAVMAHPPGAAAVFTTASESND